MKTCILFLSLLFVTYSSTAQTKTEQETTRIRQYFFVLLTKGANRNQDATTAKQIQDGHLANITTLYNDGKIKVAGPFGEEGDWQGIFIFDCATKQEVDSLLKTDPAIKAGRLNYIIKPWYTAPIGSFIPGKPKN